MVKKNGSQRRSEARNSSRFNEPSPDESMKMRDGFSVLRENPQVGCRRRDQPELHGIWREK
jgi:hypothetical protein